MSLYVAPPERESDCLPDSVMEKLLSMEETGEIFGRSDRTRCGRHSPSISKSNNKNIVTDN